MVDFFEVLYRIDDRDRRIFGDLYRPAAEKFEHGVPLEVARIPAESEDGQNVVITETRMPARFYTLHIEATADRAYEHLGTVPGKPAVEIGTGSGDDCGHLALAIAKAISEGMLGIRFSEEAGDA